MVPHAAQALVMPLAVIVGDEVLNGCPQRLLPQEDYPSKSS